MIKKLMLFAGLGLFAASCVSQKKFDELQEKYDQTSDKLSSAKLELADCLEDKKARKEEIKYLKSTNYELLKNVGNLSTLSTKEAENLEKSLESMKEKDLTIKRLQDAINKKDSVTLALVTSLKGALDDVNDEDISINVEKGMVYVAISDRLLFKSGDYDVSKDAQRVLSKVAKVINSKPSFEVMVEGHTDTVPVIPSSPIEDNWDLSTRRAASVVRILQNEHEVDPARMIAAGRSEYKPVATNETEEGRARNRRTKIVLLPKLDEFFAMIDKELNK